MKRKLRLTSCLSFEPFWIFGSAHRSCEGRKRTPVGNYQVKVCLMSQLQFYLHINFSKVRWILVDKISLGHEVPEVVRSYLCNRKKSNYYQESLRYWQRWVLRPFSCSSIQLFCKSAQNFAIGKSLHLKCHGAWTVAVHCVVCMWRHKLNTFVSKTHQFRIQRKELYDL